MLLLPLLLTACGEDSGPESSMVQEQLAKNFDTTAHITYGEIQAELRISKADGKCVATLLEPELVRDMTFVFTDDLVSIEYMGLHFDLDPNSLPAQAVASIMVSTINAAVEPYGVEMSIQDNVILLEGDSDAGRFTLRLDKENGNFLSVDIPSAGFAAEFENFTFS